MQDIGGYKGLYAVCESGRIWAYPKHSWYGRYLKPWVNNSGYEVVCLYKDKKVRKFLVHRLIAENFLTKGIYKEVNHKDGNKRNNRPENLEWVTSKENKAHAIREGLYRNVGKNPRKGVAHPRAKLTDTKVLLIRSKRSKGETSRSIAKEFGVSYHLVDLICAKKIWKHI